MTPRDPLVISDPQPRPVPPDAPVTHTRAFCVAWAMATLFHQLAFLRIAQTPLELALSVVAFAVVVAPRHALLFTALLLLQVAEVWARAPSVSNHWWTSLFVALTMLAALPSLLRGGAFRPVDWRRRFTPALRGILIVVYLWGVLHKLNADFLDPQVSCGVELYDALRTDYLPFLPRNAGIAWAAIVGTLAVETAIPVLLLIPRTRSWGILLGTSFHFFLGFVPYSVYYNFSSMLFALYLLYSDEAWVARARDALRARIGARALRGLTALALLLLLALCVGSALDGERHRELWRFLPRIPWAIYGLLAIGAYFRFREPSFAAPRARRPWWMGRVLVAAYLLNGASPYLGLKTETSLAMYSNLRTEGGRNNHLILRSTLDPTGRLDDLVVILASNDGWLRARSRDDMGLLWFEFVDYLARHPDTRVIFERKGVRERVERAGDDPRFGARVPRWQRKLIYFRPVDLRDAQRCLH